MSGSAIRPVHESAADEPDGAEHGPAVIGTGRGTGTGTGTGTRVSIDARLARARAGLPRYTPRETASLLEQDALVIDIRPRDDRAAEGEIPGSVPVERIVLEWRLAPDSPHRLPGIAPDRPVVVVCNEGYSSSLAARDLGELGLRRVGDLIGGFRAWRAEGLPVVTGGGPAVP